MKNYQLICRVATYTTPSGKIFTPEPIFYNGFEAPVEHIKTVPEKSVPKVILHRKDRYELLKSIENRVKVKKNRIRRDKELADQKKDPNVIDIYVYEELGSFVLNKMEEVLPTR